MQLVSCPNDQVPLSFRFVSFRLFRHGNEFSTTVPKTTKESFRRGEREREKGRSKQPTKHSSTGQRFICINKKENKTRRNETKRRRKKRGRRKL